MDGMAGMTAKWFDICALSDIPVRGARHLEISGQVIGLFRIMDGTVYAIENACPHLGGPLSEGIVHDCAVTCPLHNLIIDLKTGMARGPDEGQVATYPVEVRGERVFLKITS